MHRCFIQIKTLFYRFAVGRKCLNLPSYLTPSLFLTAYQSLHVERTFWLDVFRPYMLHIMVVLKCKFVTRIAFTWRIFWEFTKMFNMTFCLMLSTCNSSSIFSFAVIINSVINYVTSFSRSLKVTSEKVLTFDYITQIGAKILLIKLRYELFLTTSNAYKK